jgi:uncharacterized membrane protein HdeD (DUF308 family)
MNASPFLHEVASHWWVLALRGALAVLFGIMAFAWPGVTMAVLVLLYGAYALADGLLASIAGVKTRTWSLLGVGLLGIVAGVVTFIWPSITAIVLLYIIAFWAIFVGVFEIVTAIKLRKEMENEWLLIVSGIGFALLGLLLLFNPGAGALSVVWIIGTFAILFGIMLLLLAFRLRGLHGRMAARVAA